MKKRREVWGCYNWLHNKWVVHGLDGARMRFDEAIQAEEYAHSAFGPGVTARRFFLVKKFNPRTELTKRVIDAARKFRDVACTGGIESYQAWEDLDEALDAYDRV